MLDSKIEGICAGHERGDEQLQADARRIHILIDRMAPTITFLVYIVLYVMRIQQTLRLLRPLIIKSMADEHH